MTIKGIETFRAVTTTESEGGAIDTVPLHGPGNQLFRPVSMESRAAVLAQMAATFVPAAPKPTPSEQGHGTAPSPAEQAYAKAMEKYEAALAKYEAELAAHNSANAQNAAIDKANEPHEQKAAFWDEMRTSLLKVTTHGLAGDSYLSKQELTDLLASSDPGQRAAAEFILRNWDQVPAPKYPGWGGGMNANEMRQAAVQAGAEAASNRSLKQPHVTVPPHPGSPPSPPPPPGAQAAPTPSTPPQTTQPTPPPPTTQPTPPPPTTQSSPSTGTGDTKPAQTPDEFRAKALENSNKVPTFSSSATTGEGRMQDGLQYCQNKLEALQMDLAAAAARGDQGAISLINSEIAKFQAGLSALMQMMKQQQEMQSNMSKMFNDMAAAAIRNMR